MSVERNFGRTLSGATDLALDNIRLPDNINTIRINGNSGLPNQVLAKNGTTNKLEWDFATGTTIPDGSITGNKLAPNIDINTTGDITGAIITATDKFIQTGSNENLFNGQLRTPAITTLNSGDGLTTLNGGNVELFSDDGTTKKIELDGSTGTITCEDLNINNHTGTIEFNEIKTDKLILPITGTANCEILSSGNITTGGDITINGGNDLLVNGGGKIDLFSDNGTTRTFDIDGATGDLKIYRPSNGNEIIELDGATGNVLINEGGRIDMFDAGGDISIELNGVNGIIDCNDINVLSHTGIISFNDLRCNTFELPKTGGADFLLTSNLMTFSNPYTITGATSNATFKTLILKGGTGAADSLVILGSTDTGTDTAGNLGSITANTGDITATTGNIISTAGNVSASAGNITGSVLQFGNSIQHGTTLPSSFTVDSTGDIDTPNGNYTSLNGNITLTNGTFFGNVEGTITEEVIDAQRLNIRDGGVAGDTEINMNGNNIIVGAGSVKSSDDNISYLELDFSSNPEIGVGDGRADPLVRIDKSGILIRDEDYISQTAITIQHEAIQVNSTGTSTNKRVVINSTNGIEMYSENATGGTNQLNTQLTKDGDLEFKTNSGLMSGYFNASGTTYTDNSTAMKHMYLGATNYKNHALEIGVNIPNQVYLERVISTTSTAWFDLNDKLSVNVSSDSSTNTTFVVDFSFYAVITSGCRLFLKLYDEDATSPSNFNNQSYYNNTAAQVLLDTNGASDFAGVHNVRFLLTDFPANTSDTIRVAAWVITTSKHSITFKSGRRVGSTDPTTSTTVFPPQFLQTHKLANNSNVNTTSPTGWSAPSSGA